MGTSWIRERWIIYAVRENLDHQSNHLQVGLKCNPPNLYQRWNSRARATIVEMNLHPPPVTRKKRSTIGTRSSRSHHEGNQDYAHFKRIEVIVSIPSCPNIHLPSVKLPTSRLPDPNLHQRYPKKKSPSSP